MVLNSVQHIERSNCQAILVYIMTEQSWLADWHVLQSEVRTYTGPNLLIVQITYIMIS
jgi:hypothetical protein